MSRHPLLRRAGIALAVLCALALLAPVVLTAAGALRPEGNLLGYVLEVWERALLRSVQVSALVAPLALLIGAPAAWAFRRLPFPGSRLLESAALAPLAVPGVALAVALLQAAEAPRLGLLVAGHLAYAVPLVVRTVTLGIEALDPRLEAAARTLGAGAWETVWRVALPLLRPALVLSALLVFVVSWGELNVSLLLASPSFQTFPAALYGIYTTHPAPVAAAATLVFLAPVASALAAIQALGGELQRGVQA